MRFCFLFILLFSLSASSQTIETTTLYSSVIKDSFIIKIRKPQGYTEKKLCHLIYVADGSLKLGNYILGIDSNWKADVPENCIIISFAHTGNWHTKRQRDFLPSDAGGYKDKNFGQAHNFYLFLKQTLLPFINNKFKQHQSTAFIGHSFSGLFCLYTLFREDKLFDKHFAISPSVWANHGELLKLEEAFYKKKKALTATVSLQAGGLEIFNKVLTSTKEFYNITQKRKYTGYTIGFSTVNNANHYSMIKPGVDKILLSFKK
jgi:predicted alpha/beta superfamily hydrolase